MRSKTFRFDPQFRLDQLDVFLSDFFGDATVQEHLPVCTGLNAQGTGTVREASWGSIGPVKAGSVRYSQLRSTVLKLDFFDRLNEAEIVRSGSISKCFDVQCGDLLVSDRLRKLFVDDSSEEWDLYSAQERSELIFHVLRRLAVGGGMNQYDDEMAPYLNFTKALYKDLVTVHKGAGGLQVSSLTVEVTGISGASLFPRDSPHNFCYITIDPVGRTVKAMYGAWFSMM